jgi:3-oxosteroid 1-dehydrogenase
MAKTDFDETFDFVVVGSGGGSMCAGLLLRSLGKSVLILEKTELVGGTTSKSGGVMWIPNNMFMARDGVDDSYEQASAYLDAVVGDDDDAPGATRERRATYLAQAPKMVDFLVKQGIKLTRVSYWPDYYDEQPGGSQKGRTVVAELFDTNELGPWKDKLRPGFLSFPAMLEEAMLMRTFKQSWAGKALMAKIGLRTAFAKLRGQNWVSSGTALQGRMLQAALKAGIDIRTESPVTELIEENGVIAGVVTVRDGRTLKVRADLGVLVNAGGFSLNQRMRDQYQPGTQAAWSQATPGDTGEMIEEMMRHGAAVAQMDAMVGYQTSLPPGAEKDDIKPSMQGVCAAPHAILVDQSGVRYQNEGGSYMAFCKGMLERNKTVPAVPSWAILDSQYMRNYMINGTMPGSTKPQTWFDSGYMHRADTVEELAAKISIDPEVLRGTVDRFNGFVEAGRDEDFHRGDRAYDRWLGDPYHERSETLGTVSQGPYYAVPVVPGDVGTYGGVVTDVNARVLRADGSPIPGLYATGISTASVMGRAYPGAGSSVGPSFLWGYVAAKHAAKADNIAN